MPDLPQFYPPNKAYWLGLIVVIPHINHLCIYEDWNRSFGVRWL